ncbi:hypothetical protein GCM10011515_10050 [Tsuneonella deserti]|uniref:Uncharacterized protein n=1 Tax=Tsuneonella deserti TaxID=2035528 RepID=A0ABQ1S4F4_9SPHN|nr:hypothetical protein GCM10011515_10050 [Tsuneonella deserti]
MPGCEQHSQDSQLLIAVLTPSIDPKGDEYGDYWPDYDAQQGEQFIELKPKEGVSVHPNIPTNFSNK